MIYIRSNLGYYKLSKLKKILLIETTINRNSKLTPPIILTNNNTGFLRMLTIRKNEPGKAGLVESNKNYISKYSFLRRAGQLPDFSLL